MQNISVKYDGYKFNITEKNPLFSDAKIYVMYHGENRNNSHISKEDVDRAINSIYNIPIVGEFIEDDNGEEDSNFGGHGGKLIIDDNGAQFIQTTKPMGVVPESANVYWEVVKDEKGRDREYLVVEGALLWNRYEDAVNTLKSANFGQSMEIEVEEGFFNDDDGIYHITDFSFSAFCVLGIDDRKNGKVEPAFEDSKIITYSKEFSSELKEMKDELNEYLVSYSKEKEVNTLENDKKQDKAEKFDLESAKEAVAKAEETKEASDVEKARELVSELEDGEEKDKLIERLDAIDVSTDDDEEDDEDFEAKDDEDDEEKEPEIVETETTGIAGDPVTTEEEAEENKGTAGDTGGADTEDDARAIADANTETDVDTATTGSDPQAIADANTETDYSVKYEELKKSYKEVEAELEELREFKKAVEKEEHEKASIELFDRLGLGEKDVKDLNIYEYTIEELEEKCYSILGRKMANEAKEEFSVKTEEKVKTNKVDLSRAGTESKTTRYGNLFSKFSTK